jgi:tetratricopeptide (TPR) repeat protein
MIVLGAGSLLPLESALNMESSTSAATSTVLGKLRSLLLKPSAKTQEPMASQKFKALLAVILSPIELQDAIMQLQNRSLIKRLRGADRSTLRMHDLTRIMIRGRSSKGGDEQEWFDLAAALCCCAFSRCVANPESPEYWLHCAIFIPHFQQLTRQDKLYGNRNATLVEANMDIVRYLWSCGRYKDAEMLCEQVRAVRMERLGVEHPQTLTTLHNLAQVYELQGRYGDAEKLYKQVLAAREKILGETHPSTLTTMHNLADIYESQGHYGDAESLYNRVLPVQKKILGEEHPSALTTMHNLALVYKSQGRYSDAETLYKQVLVVEEKILGEKHPDTLSTMHNIAHVHESQGRYTDAETLFKRVLVVEEKIFGEEHPSTLITMHNLADVYESQGHYSDAEALYNRVLAVKVKILGEEHPSTLTTMHNLAYVYKSQGRYSDAEALFKRVLVVEERILGVAHPHTLTAIKNLADVYESLERHTDAENLRGQALAVREAHNSQNFHNDASQSDPPIEGMSFVLFDTLRLRTHHRLDRLLELALPSQISQQQQRQQTIESLALS